MGRIKWKWIPGYEGLYKINKIGQVLSYQKPTPTILKRRIADTGYVVVRLYKNKKSKIKTTHRLVLEAFTGPCPEGMEASHLDGDRANSKLSNLLWETRKENHNRKKEHGTSCGWNLTEETRNKISNIHKGKKLSEQHKNKISKSVSGKSNGFYGKRHTEKSKTIMRNKAIGRKHSIKTRRKMSKSHRNRLIENA